MTNTDKIVYLPQLQRYDEKIKGWADGKFLKEDRRLLASQCY